MYRTCSSVTLNDVRAVGHRFCNALDDVLRQWKCWLVVVHINQVDDQLQNRIYIVIIIPRTFSQWKFIKHSLGLSIRPTPLYL